MNEYERKQEARRERYSERAAKAEAEANRECDRAMELGRQIPLGQPILVGHHSERGHRAHLARMDRAMRRSLDATAKAAHYRGKAAGVGRAGISSDDPDALDKLRAKLAKLELRQAVRKHVNACWRKAGKPRACLQNREEAARCETQDAEKWAKLGALLAEPAHFPGLVVPIPKLPTMEDVRQMMRGDCMHRPPFTYELQNASGNMRRIRQRVEALEKRARVREALEAEGGDVERAGELHGEGVRVFDDHEANRTCVEFDAKPAPDVRSALKREGFRWNRTLGAWTRHMSNGARYAACRAVGIDTEASSRVQS